MRIAIDLDGVLVDFLSGWRAAYEESFGAHLSEASLTTWDSIVTATHFRTSGEFFAWLREIPGFWARLRAIPGGERAIEDLLRRGHAIAFATQRPPEAYEQTEAWLRRWTTRGAALHFVQDKVSLALDAYVDDSPEVLLELSRDSSAVPIRFVQPWNAGSPGLPAHGWTAVVPIIDRLAFRQKACRVQPAERDARPRSARPDGAMHQ